MKSKKLDVKYDFYDMGTAKGLKLTFLDSETFKKLKPKILKVIFGTTVDILGGSFKDSSNEKSKDSYPLSIRFKVVDTVNIKDLYENFSEESENLGSVDIFNDL